MNAAEIMFSCHLGTHADGRAHTADGQPPIGEAPLEAYLGAARVVGAPGAAVLGPELLQGF